MRILVAVEAQDFRKGIDGLARICREVLEVDPFGGTLFVFRNRRGTAINCFDRNSHFMDTPRPTLHRFLARTEPQFARGLVDVDAPS